MIKLLFNNFLFEQHDQKDTLKKMNIASFKVKENHKYIAYESDPDEDIDTIIEQFKKKISEEQK